MYQVSFNRPVCASKPVAKATPVRASQNSVTKPKQLVAQGLIAASVLLGSNAAFAQTIYTPGYTQDTKSDVYKNLQRLPDLKDYPGENKELKNNSPSGLAVKEEQQIMDKALAEGNNQLKANQQSPSSQPPADQQQVNLPNPFSGTTTSSVVAGDSLDNEVSKEEKQSESESPENIAKEKDYKPNTPARPSKSSSFVV